MSERKTLQAIEADLAKHTHEMRQYLTKQWVDQGALSMFVINAEKTIQAMHRGGLTSSELKRKFRHDFKETLSTGKHYSRYHDVKAIFEYLDDRIDWRDEYLWLHIPPNAETTTVKSTNGVHDLVVVIRWLATGPVDEKALKTSTLEYVNFYRKREAEHDYLAQKLSEFSGVGAVHIAQAFYRKKLPGSGIVVYSMDIQELPVPAPPPPVGTILLGYQEKTRDRKEPVVLTPQRREEHVYIVGRTRSGKTTLLRSLILQDIEEGRGVGVIDPHGDLAQDLLRSIPREREKDVVFLSQESPVPISVFRATSDSERDLIASDVITLFKRQSESWGPRMDALLRFVVATLVRVPNSTFLDIHRMLIDPAFRADAVGKAKTPAITDYWSLEYPSYPKDAATPITSRLAQFRLSTLLTELLDQPKGLDFYEHMGEGKIFIADIAKGNIGEDNMLLLGSLLVSQIQLAAMRRAKLPKSERVPFYFYVDEFQNFKTTTFPVILSEASKYGLSLTMAHQHISQLDEDTRDSVVGNVGTRIFFALGAPDAKFATPYIGSLDPQKLVNFGRGEAIYSPPRTKESIEFRTHIHESAVPKARPADIMEATTREYVQPVKLTLVPTPKGDEPEPGEWPTN